MMIKEWENYQKVKDKNNPFCDLFILPGGEKFYVEPVFYTKLEAMFVFHPNERERILNKMKEIILKNKNVVFTGDFEYIQTDVGDEKFIYLEIEDITNPLNIYVEDKSRGSDYGD